VPHLNLVVYVPWCPPPTPRIQCWVAAGVSAEDALGSKRHFNIDFWGRGVGAGGGRAAKQDGNKRQITERIYSTSIPRSRMAADGGTMAPPPTRLGSNLSLAPVSAPAPCPSAPNTCNGEGDEGHEGEEGRGCPEGDEGIELSKR
jgi:hypothetical protein